MFSKLELCDQKSLQALEETEDYVSRYFTKVTTLSTVKELKIRNETSTELEKRIQDWFANNKSPFIHDFGNTSLSRDRIYAAIKYLAPKGYVIQDDVRNVLKVTLKQK